MGGVILQRGVEKYFLTRWNNIVSLHRRLRQDARKRILRNRLQTT